jgi:hypothetical protein
LTLFAACFTIPQWYDYKALPCQSERNVLLPTINYFKESS